MSTSTKLSNERYLPIKKLGKLYLYLLIGVRLAFLMQQVPNSADLSIDNNIIDVSKFVLQFILGNEFVKRACILFLALYSMFVAVESFIVLRSWLVWIYSKVTKRKVIE